MLDNFPGQADRLDSWKAIADYLQRDVRTVRRWEKALGLPVRRVPGRSGSSVFAYVSEIEQWLQTSPESRAQAADTPNLQPETLAAPPARRWRWSLAAGAAVVLVVAGVVWTTYGAGAASDLVSVRVSKSAIVGLGTDGVELWRSPFPADEVVSALDVPGTTGRAAADGAVMVAVSTRTNTVDNTPRSGQLLWMTRSGRIDRRFEFEDALMFGAGEYTAPWVMLDARRDPGDGRRIAVVAHHFQWWPSLVAVVDDHGKRSGTFVHAGWVEWVNWLTPDRLLISGYSNERDGGMVALLDARALNGQSPTLNGSPFFCTTCGDDRPLRYFVFPRSEVNLATGSPFNRALMQIGADRVIARTIEVPYTYDGAASTSIDALYEFTPAMDFVRATYSDRYWDLHRVLERQGKITHTREQCPDRAGPRQVQMWDRAGGWRTIEINQPSAAH